MNTEREDDQRRQQQQDNDARSTDVVAQTECVFASAYLLEITK